MSYDSGRKSRITKYELPHPAVEIDRTADIANGATSAPPAKEKQLRVTDCELPGGGIDHGIVDIAEGATSAPPANYELRITGAAPEIDRTADLASGAIPHCGTPPV